MRNPEEGWKGEGGLRKAKSSSLSKQGPEIQAKSKTPDAPAIVTKSVGSSCLKDKWGAKSEERKSSMRSQRGKPFPGMHEKGKRISDKSPMARSLSTKGFEGCTSNKSMAFEPVWDNWASPSGPPSERRGKNTNRRVDSPEGTSGEKLR